VLRQVPYGSKVVPRPLICHLPVRAEDDTQIWVQDIKFADGFSTEAGSVMVYLFRVQEVCIRSLDHQGVIVMSSKFSQPLMHHRHYGEVGKKVIQCLTLHCSSSCQCDIHSFHSPGIHLVSPDARSSSL